VTPIRVPIVNVTSIEAANPRRAGRSPMNPLGFALILRIIRALHHKMTIATGSATHFRRQDATSPALTIDPKEGGKPLNSIKAAITEPMNTANIAKPLADTATARPYEGSSCSGFARGGPTERAPQDGQPSRRSPSKFEPQEGQLIKVYLPLEIKNAGLN
jgi:hypothetical protein